MEALTKFWKTLQSGTDIRGIASEGIAGQEINLTDDVVGKIAQGFAQWLADIQQKTFEELKIAVGHDSRISAPRIRQAALSAFSQLGVTVIDCGLASTPSMFLTTLDLHCDGAVEITASHHPFNRNGLKFFTKNGGLEREDITSILLHAQSLDDLQQHGAPGPIVHTNYMARYSRRLQDLIKEGVQAEDYDHPLQGFHIVVDAGNGAGGFYASQVLEPLGANTQDSQFLEPDGMFPNHVPNPEDPAAMESICQATLAAKADLGVIFDTDVDRGGAVDCHGKEINRNRLVALAAAIALEGNKGGTIVTDSITSDGLKAYIETTLGGVHHRFKRGYKNVINEAIRLNQEGVNCPLAIETSGHAAMRENYFLDDGAYLVTKIIIQMAVLRKQGKSLEAILSPLAEPKEAVELRLPITDEDFRACGNRILTDLEAYAQAHQWQIAPDNREGLRVSFPPEEGNGWFLLRLSVHDPILPLNIESDSVGGVRQILTQLQKYLSKCPGLQIHPLEEFLQA